jgi:hypothetical protein
MESNANYDSTSDTLIHIRNVQGKLNAVARELTIRGEKHDSSKLLSPEKEIFDEYTPKLKNSTYGSDEYKSFLIGMGEALKHHYDNNRHHPEHFSNGINGMTLIDLIEMFCDWKAASERHADGDIFKSIEINSKRFNIDGQLKKILINTAEQLFKK